MKNMKYLAILALLGGLLSAGSAQAFSERLSVDEAYQAQQASCQLGQAALVGGGWSTCEQYLYEWVSLAGAAQSQNQTLVALQSKVLELIRQISALNASLATVTR
jgi:hypothetical protein